MVSNFGEVLTAMVTPFKENLSIDLEQARNLASYLVDNGSDGLVVLGTTGEVPTLTKKEKLSLLETVVEEVGDRAKIVAGTGSYSTEDSIYMTQQAEKIGVDGAMLVVPYYNKPPQDGLYNHYQQVAASTTLPIMIYNVPSRTSRNIEPETVSRLAKIENIIAIKEASGDLSQVAEICRTTDDDFYVYSGEDSITLPLLSVGGQGIISVAAHLVGSKMKKMVRNFKTGNIEKAIQLNQELLPIYKGMFITTNPIPVKAALNMLGHNVGGLRPPLVDINQPEKEKLKNILENNGLL